MDVQPRFSVKEGSQSADIHSFEMMHHAGHRCMPGNTHSGAAATAALNKVKNEL
jgi:hypothetical protein